MVKYNQFRIEQRNEQYQRFCQRNKITPGIYQRISWELMTRGVISADKFEHLNLNKLTLKRIFTDLEINSMWHTGTSYTKLQTIDEIFHYAINHPKNRGKKLEKIEEKRINDFLKNI
jgi:hypothetical protein